MLSIWAVTGREAVQHADSDAGWRFGRRDSGLNPDPKTQAHWYAHSGGARVRARVRVDYPTALSFLLPWP